MGNIAVRCPRKCLVRAVDLVEAAEQRTSEFGDQRIADFGSTAQAAYAYALNLNTEPAYRDLRRKRADLRRKSLHISGTVLAETLGNYSERG